MNQECVKAIKPSIEEVRRRFETWRETRKKRKPIPKDLWQAAVELTEHYPTHMVSKTLRLNHTDLKKRMHERAGSELVSNPKPEAAFIELDLSQMSPGQWSVEMENPNRARMRMCFTGKTGIDPLEVVRAFLKGP